MAGSGDLEEARISLDGLSNKKKAVSKFMTKNPQFDHYQVRIAFFHFYVSSVLLNRHS